MIIDYVLNALLPLLPPDRPLRHLDVSAGWGDLIRKLHAERPRILSEACDYPIAPELEGIPVKEVNLHKEALPYDDDRFDLVTCTEVFEHLENHRPVLREIFRILKPGGIAAISMPNILSFRSRLKFLARGTYEYFDPLPTARDLGSHSWMRHINPVTFYHLALAMVDCGFENIRTHSGKIQKLSMCFCWLALFFRMNVQAAKRMRIRKNIPVTVISEDLAEMNNSWNVFSSRTLIVTAHKTLSCAASNLPTMYQPAPPGCINYLGN